MSISGGATTETTITGLDAGTVYSIEVAAVNKADIGKYSVPLTVSTQGVVFKKSITSLSLNYSRINNILQKLYNMTVKGTETRGVNPPPTDHIQCPHPH